MFAFELDIKYSFSIQSCVAKFMCTIAVARPIKILLLLPFSLFITNAKRYEQNTNNIYEYGLSFRLIFKYKLMTYSILFIFIEKQINGIYLEISLTCQRCSNACKLKKQKKQIYLRVDLS